MRKLGFHVSISGSISNSIRNAENLGCTAFQIFSRNPRGWKSKILSISEINDFTDKLKNSKFDRDAIAVHMPYLPNLSAPPGEAYQKSVNVFLDEVYRCNMLEIPLLIIHLGSHLGKGSSAGIEQLVNSFHYIDTRLDEEEKKNNVRILLENSAGQKNSIGNNFNELGLILDKINFKSIGICFDTCHAFVSGYDLTTIEKVEETFDNFNTIIGLDKLFLIHLNDSKGEIGSHLDRHEHIGLGKIGESGMSAILNNSRLVNIPIIMETPIDNIRDDLGNFKMVKQLIQEQFR